ncbi:cytochrome b/b6 domain-containing protein [Pantoea piersonii]|jgi:hypothetical protein|uniref:cytochrome b/b6 domain-containing protein n=1 Tax=Pantoea piersonii TaxID=2364647 RepID=UPI000EA3805E|nr:cytochrome b/b6 domain-containing protein [Pantoea piersonii]MBZ6386760.1 cytochrome b/b6 domain-containing protein [Pantoea piersonii]MBZ6400091.1 cytochrome b/b6 domain-containing protein [Pantoea piersonii]MBZ6410093.1 cytochrome b/b6 domain-containing protein [Pantoea piersonii]MBZ6426142.1 cytochrome b/b6 domain-containing protein [Pantoea piersonii]NYB04631.1 cytochrome b/b6 domain-containing protein [Pantoea piersonii]
MAVNLRNALSHQGNSVIRTLHIIVAVLVLAQIINSNLTEREALGQLSLQGIVTWLHVISGFGLLFCGFIMLYWMLTQRGFLYYFSWVRLDFRGIAEDFSMLRQFRLPEAHTGGIAAIVQGLGVLSLLGVAACGGLWFFLNIIYGPDSVLTHQILHLHKFLTVFIETYFWAHGAMGVVHFFLTFRPQRL